MPLIHEKITPIPNTEPDAVPALWNTRYTEIDENFADHETRVAAAESELTGARGNFATLDERIDIIEEVTGTLEGTSAIAVQKAVGLDWMYRGNRIAFELWRDGYTMIDLADAELVHGVAGDDSIDVVSTVGIHTGDYYAVKDSGGSPFLVQITDVLSLQRVRVIPDLPRNLTTGVLTRCSMAQVNHEAMAVVGDFWLSRTVNIEYDSTGGAVVIRRTLNSGDAHLYYRDANSSNWGEVFWSLRRQGGDIQAGFADYEYIVPFQGDTQLRIDIATEDMTIQHVVVLAQETGLGGFLNPAMSPLAPTISAPADGATGIFDSPTLAISSYSTPGGTPQKGIQFQVSTVNTFATIVKDSGFLPPSLSYILPTGNIAANTTYYVRARVQDVAGLWSAWSTASSFTTATSFSYVATPSLVTPVNNAVDLVSNPMMQTDGFSMVNGTDTHAASQWQVRTAEGSWTAPFWDSGEDAVNLLSITLPEGTLDAGQSIYYFRARHKGTTLGWSEYSTEIKATTKQVFQQVIGVCCSQPGGNGGVWVYVNEAGETTPPPGATYFNEHPVFGAIQDIMIDNQYMVRVPKFYVKRGLITGGVNDGKEAWWISDQPAEGFHLHSAFMDYGIPIDQFYVGKYISSLTSSTPETMLSRPEGSGYYARTHVQEIAAATMRNQNGITGFMLWSIYQFGAIQWLYLVENATMNSQAKTAYGATELTSSCSAPSALAAAYRGITGLWGDGASAYGRSVDGLLTDPVTNTIKLWDNNGSRTYVDTGVAPTFAGEIKLFYPLTFMTGSGAFHNYDDIFIGDTGPTTNAEATAPDKVHMDFDNEAFAKVGRGYQDGSDMGLFAIHCHYAQLDTASGVGRLAKI